MPIWMNIVLTVMICIVVGCAAAALVIIAIGGKSEEEMREVMQSAEGKEHGEKSQGKSKKSQVKSDALSEAEG